MYSDTKRSVFFIDTKRFNFFRQVRDRILSAKTLEPLASFVGKLSAHLTLRTRICLGLEIEVLGDR